MRLSETLQCHAASDVGRIRAHNEDSFLADPSLGLFVVADGMGGHAAGEVASSKAVQAVHETVKHYESWLKGIDPATSGPQLCTMLETAVQRACASIHELGELDSSKRGMGTTLTALLLLGNQAVIAHVGDSRVYLFRDERVQQVTEDHNVFNELLRRGKFTREEIERIPQKNALTRAVGVYANVETDTLSLEVLPGDQFLLASDGLHGYLDSAEALLPSFLASDGDATVRALIDLANESGGKDNITAVLVRLGVGDADDLARARRHALKREVLHAMPLFSLLDEGELLQVMQFAVVSAFEAGQVVVREGDAGEELFIVLSGKLKVQRGDTVLTELKTGEHFGEMALVRAMPRSATVVAVEPSELLALRRADFFGLVRHEPALAVKLLWQFVGVLGNRLDQTNRDLTSARVELAAEDITGQIFPAALGAAPRASFGGPSGRSLPPPPPPRSARPPQAR